MTKVAINGFGRIGRMTFRKLMERGDMEVVAINDLTDIHTLAQLLKFDSVQGQFPWELTHTEGSITTKNQTIKVCNEGDPANLPWKELDVDVVIECTGRFRTKETAAKHIEAGAKRVILSAPAGDKEIPFLVLGVNSEVLDGGHDIISNASCTTNCAAPMISVIHENLGVSQGTLTTIHAYTADQRLLDTPHKDLRRARAAALSIIPTTTGAARAVGRVIPEMKGKLEGMACRVPVATGSFTDLTLLVEKDTTREAVNSMFKAQADTDMKGILEYSEDDLVSVDIIGNPHSCIFDSKLTQVYGHVVKIFGWYDNEMGYSARLADVTAEVAKRI